MMGLEYFVNVNAKGHIRVLGDRRTHHQDLKVNVKGREGPPKHDSPPKSLPR